MRAPYEGVPGPVALKHALENYLAGAKAPAQKVMQIAAPNERGGESERR